MTDKLSKNFRGVGVGPLSNVLAVKKTWLPIFPLLKIHYGPSIMSQGKTPRKDTQGEVTRV